MQPDRGQNLLKNLDFSTFPSDMLLNLAFFGGDTPEVLCLNYSENTIGTYCKPVGSTDTGLDLDGWGKDGFPSPKALSQLLGAQAQA